MLASSQLDLTIGVDIHLEIVPPSPSPVPFPHPYVGLIEFTPIAALIQIGIAKLTSWAFDAPTRGPVFINGFLATVIGDEASNKKTLPHFVIPPGVKFVPLPSPFKMLPPKPPRKGQKLPVAPPGDPPGDAVFISGSESVHIEGRSACRLGTIAMSCSDPVRLPSSVLLPIPKGMPVLIGGPTSFNWSTIAKTLIFRNKWMAGALRQVIANRLRPGRLRSLLEWGVCELTGHPIDVATGRLLSRADDFVLRGPIPLTFERFYDSSWSARHSPIGYGWSHSLHEGIWTERGKIVLKCGDGREVEFHTNDLPGRRLHEGGRLFERISRLTVRYLGDGRYEIQSTDGLTREFGRLPGNSAVSVIKRIRDRIGHFVDFEYDRHCLLEVVRTSEGRWIRLEHVNGLLQRVAVQTPEGNDGGWYDQVTFEYSAQGDLIAARDSQRRARTYRYDRHLLIQETDRDAVSFFFEYDGADENASCVRTWGDDGKGQNRLFFREVTYDKRNQQTFVEDSLGRVTCYQMDVLNTVVQITDPLAGVTKREYNDFCWKTAETDALGHITRWEHDARGNETKITMPNGGIVAMRYDAHDELVDVIDPLGGRWTWAYDQLGRVTMRTTPSGTIWFEYHGRYLSKVTLDGSKVFACEHNAFGEMSRVVFSDGTFQERWFDRQGRIVKIRDGAGHVRRVEWDWESRVIRVDEPGGLVRKVEHTPEGDVISYADQTSRMQFGYCGYHQHAWTSDGGAARLEYRYNSEDELVAIVNEAGETYSIELDACGHVAAEVGFDLRRTTYQRDALGRATKRIRPSKAADAFEYDAMGSLTRAKYGDGAEETFTYDLAGELATATNAAGAVRIQRDGEGRILAEWFGNNWIASKYDGGGARTEVTSSLGLAARITASATGDARDVTLWERGKQGLSHASWRVQFERDALGNEIGRHMPGGVDAGMMRNEAGLPVAQTVATGGKIVSQRQYAWTGDERLRGMRTLAPDGKTADTWFHHDDRGRLVSATLPDSSVQWRAPSATGNIFQSGEQTDRKYGRAGILLENRGTRYEYDLDGNLEKRTDPDGSLWAYAWNGNGTLAHVVKPDGAKVAFTYDALGRRVSKSAGERTTHWLWDGEVPVHETVEEDGRSSTTTWVFEPDSFAPIGRVLPDGTKHSIVCDYLGTPTEMFDEAGKLAWKAQLDIHGVLKVEEGAARDCPWRWPGQYEDEETGLRYNRYRYYDPERGDYISQDPIGVRGGPELYSYVADPLIWIDPLGLHPCHHIATDKNEKSKARGGPWTPKFKKFFSGARMNISKDKHNLVKVPGHKGPHPEAYHQAVFVALTSATEGKKPYTAAYRKAVEGALDDLKKKILKPGSPLNKLVTKT